MFRPLVYLAGVSLILGGVAIAADIPPTLNGLVRVNSKQFAGVYLLPNADFRPYSTIMIDPTQVSFKKDWQKEANRSAVRSGGRVSDADARRILDAASASFQKLFVQEYQKAGYHVVNKPGFDVLRLSTAVVNIDVAAPDTHIAGRSYTFSRDVGSAQLIIEAKDSLSGQVLGIVVDRREIDDFRPYLRNSVTNSAGFESLFSRWAKTSAKGLGLLRSTSPVNAQGIHKK
jgi:hypothetical protein